jgi:hypothetical protein
MVAMNRMAPMMKFLARVGAVLAIALCGAAQAFCIPSHSDNEVEPAEYYDAASDRYFLAWSSPSVVGGCTPPYLSRPASVGSTRTGLGWTTVAHAYACNFPSPASDSPACSLIRRVCAFEDESTPQPRSLFLTINAGECEALKRPGSGWRYQPMTTAGETGGPSLSAFEVDPATGACHPDHVPVHRFVKTSGRGPRNHRYVADGAVVQEMRGRGGWVLEGIAFCVLWSSRTPLGKAALQFLGFQGPAPAATCDNGVGRVTTCIESDNMPALRTVVRMDPPSPFASRTGAFDSVSWAYIQPFATPEEAATHSFAQTFGTSQGAGFFVTSRDRVAGNVSSLRGRAELIAELAPFLSTYEVDMDLVLHYRLFVKRARVAEGAGSQAYVQPLVTLRDERSGLRMALSPGAIGTPSMADGTFRDAATGDVTLFIALGASAIGRSLGLPALSIPKSFDAENAWGWGGDFHFRINRIEFARALERARAMDPRLSADPADYRVEALSLKGEVAGEGEIGYQVERMELSVVRP